MLVKEYLDTEMFSLLTGLRYANLPDMASFLKDGTCEGLVSSNFLESLSITVLGLNGIVFKWAGGYNFLLLNRFDTVGTRLDDVTLCV